VVAKLLYLAKKVRPDILTAVAFLATRVQKPTLHNQAKLMRVLKYLNGTPDRGTVLEPGTVVEPKAFVDASFAPHADGHSHSGSVITLGKGPIFVRIQIRSYQSPPGQSVSNRIDPQRQACIEQIMPCKYHVFLRER
jgi:hypothetical protein